MRIFIIFARHHDIGVRRIFILDKNPVFGRCQANLVDVGGADHCHRDFRIVQYLGQLRTFQFHNLVVVRVGTDIQRGWQQAFALLELDQPNLFQQQQGAAQVGRIVRDGNYRAVLQL
ncbi:hypothetical protein D3C78_1514310 [compost metagenome]